MPRKTYKKRSYKKRTYKARRYRKRYYRRRFYKRSAIKKPEIHILKEDYDFSADEGDYTNGQFINLTPISAVANSTQNDNMEFKVGDKQIEGKKIRLKYLYIKGYYQLSYSYQGSGEDDNTNDNNVNAKLYVFRIKKNTSNSNFSWSSFIDMPINSSNPSSWAYPDIQNILYAYDWKNDIKTNVVKKVKNLYKSYDNTNNIIPFKIRIPLYDCVLTCENQYYSANNVWVPNSNPSTNQIVLSFITLGSLTSKTAQQRAQFLHLKTKLYYTDY